MNKCVATQNSTALQAQLKTGCVTRAPGPSSRRMLFGVVTPTKPLSAWANKRLLLRQLNHICDPCRCNNGRVATGAACPQPGANRCTACNTGFYINKKKTWCIKKAPTKNPTAKATTRRPTAASTTQNTPWVVPVVTSKFMNWYMSEGEKGCKNSAAITIATLQQATLPSCQQACNKIANCSGFELGAVRKTQGICRLHSGPCVVGGTWCFPCRKDWKVFQHTDKQWSVYKRGDHPPSPRALRAHDIVQLDYCA